MPILHIQFSGQQKTSDDTDVQIHPQQVMYRRGPILQVNVSVISTVAQQVIQQGKELPSPISGLALVDTGASTTCIDDEVARK